MGRNKSTVSATARPTVAANKSPVARILMIVMSEVSNEYVEREAEESRAVEQTVSKNECKVKQAREASKELHLR